MTNLPGWMVTPMLQVARIEDFFQSVVDWSRPSRRKPNPDPILVALDDLALGASDDIWYVGDSEGDCRAAISAGISFAWAAYGYSDDPPAGTSAVIARFDEVMTL